jgi:threonine aldolase
VLTNLVIFELAPDAPSPAEFGSGLAAQGVKVGAVGGRRFRAVTHYGIDANDVDYALEAAKVTLKG